MKKLGRFVALGLLTLTSVLGLYNGPRELGTGVTELQNSVTVAVILYGVLGALAVIGTLRRRPWAVTMAMGWVLASCWAGSVASFAFSDPGFTQPGTWVGVVASGVSILAIGAFIVWMVRDAVRVSSPEPTGHIHTP